MVVTGAVAEGICKKDIVVFFVQFMQDINFYDGYDCCDPYDSTELVVVLYCPMLI